MHLDVGFLFQFPVMFVDDFFNMFLYTGIDELDWRDNMIPACPSFIA